MYKLYKCIYISAKYTLQYIWIEALGAASRRARERDREIGRTQIANMAFFHVGNPQNPQKSQKKQTISHDLGQNIITHPHTYRMAYRAYIYQRCK